jgi:DNA-binding transcriptional MocR family regulator
MVMTVPIGREMAQIDGRALADLLGYWSAPDGSLYRLLAARIARLADTGGLPPGLRLPAERELAVALSVSRNTVAMAYQLLRDDGMAESRQGSGTRIVPHRTTPAAVHRANAFFAGLLEESEIRADLTLAIVDCAPQVEAALDDPASVLTRAERRAVTQSSGSFSAGLPALRSAVAGVLATRFAVPTGAAQVVVTTGAQQALDLLIRCEVRPGQAAVVEDPTFPGALDALQRAGARMIGLPGSNLDLLAHLLRTQRPALVYLVPTHHNPTGRVLSRQDRERIVALAEANPDVTFIEDMALAELPLTDAPAPPLLAAIAPDQPNIVTVGSMSKLYWGGLRTGWIRASTGMTGMLAAAKAITDLGSPAFQQAIAAALIAGQHDSIVKWRCEWLRPRYQAARDGLARHLPHWTWTPPDGGLTIWARLPADRDSGAFTQAALRHGVAVVPGRLLSVSGSSPSPYVRLSFTAPPQQLAVATAALARADTQVVDDEQR